MSFWPEMIILWSFSMFKRVNWIKLIILRSRLSILDVVLKFRGPEGYRWSPWSIWSKIRLIWNRLFITYWYARKHFWMRVFTVSPIFICRNSLWIDFHSQHGEQFRYPAIFEHIFRVDFSSILVSKLLCDFYDRDDSSVYDRAY